MAMGNYLQAENRLELAARSFEIAWRHGQVALEPWHRRDLGELSAMCLSLTLQLLGRDDRARQVLEEALGRDVSSSRLRWRLIELLAKERREEEALRVGELLPVGNEFRPALKKAIRGACKAAAGQWTQALGYLQTAYLLGFRDAFCLRWLAITLMCGGQPAAAEPVLREWQRAEPNNGEVQKYLAAVTTQARAAEGQPTSDAADRRLRVDQAGHIAAAGAALPTATSTSPPPTVSR